MNYIDSTAVIDTLSLFPHGGGGEYDGLITFVLIVYGAAIIAAAVAIGFLASWVSRGCP